MPAPTAAPATTVAPTTAPPTTTPPTTAPPGPPSAENPADVLVVGDSFAGAVGAATLDLLDETGIVETEIDYRMSTGLARPTKFDWYARLEERLPEADPDIVISSFGGNDFVGLQDDDGSVVVGDPVTNEEKWVAEYEQRAGRMMDLLGQDGRTVIWVGTANHPDPAKSDGLALQDRAAKAAAAERPGVVFVDTWDLLARPRRWVGGVRHRSARRRRQGRADGRRVPPQRDRQSRSWRGRSPSKSAPRSVPRVVPRSSPSECLDPSECCEVGKIEVQHSDGSAPDATRTIVHGSGLRTSVTSKRWATNRWKPQRVQWLTWPGVLPHSLR